MNHLYRTICLLLFAGFHQLCAQESRASLGAMFGDTNVFSYELLPINSAASDFGVSAWNGGYVFSSARENRMMIRYFNTNDAPLFDLYYFSERDSGRYSAPKPFATEIRSKENEGPVAVAHSGSFMIVTANNAAGAQGESPLMLFESQRENSSWGKPQVLSFCKAGSRYVHPALSANDSVLFFASDCPGGYGGLDLWISYRTATGWSQPKNAGAAINTSYDETFPFCALNGNLYFSSNRPGGAGGLDIYAWRVHDSDYVQPERLAGLINSPADDFSFWMDGQERKGFFSSNRENAADDNIYSFSLQRPEIAVPDTVVMPQLCYTFFEQATLTTNDTAMMKYTWNFSDGTQKLGYEVYKCFDTAGLYDIHLEVRDSSGGDVVISEIEYEFEIASPNYVEYLVPDTVQAHELFPLDTRNANIAGFSIENVFVDFGDGYRATGRSLMHTYHHTGTYYPRVYFRLRNTETGAVEYRCTVKPIRII
jgi:hypothetical protein